MNPELQFNDTESRIKNKRIDLLSELRGFKFMATSVFELKKIENDIKTKFSTFYSNSKAEKSINESDINVMFESIYTTIMSNMQKFLGKDSGWIIDSVIDHTINISKYNPLAGCSYIKLPKELDHPKKGLINIQHFDDSKNLNWCLFRYL